MWSSSCLSPIWLVQTTLALCGKVFWHYIWLLSYSCCPNVGGVPMNRCYEGVIGPHGYKGVQNRYETIIFGDFHGDLDVGINRVHVLEELVTMFSLLDDKSVIHILKIEPGWMWADWWLWLQTLPWTDL